MARPSHLGGDARFTIESLAATEPFRHTRFGRSAGPGAIACTSSIEVQGSYGAQSAVLDLADMTTDAVIPPASVGPLDVPVSGLTGLPIGWSNISDGRAGLAPRPKRRVQ